MREKDPRHAGAARVPSSGHDPGCRDAARLLSGAAREADFDAAIQAALERMLVDPDFLFRIEREPRPGRAGRSYRVERHRAGVAPVVLSCGAASRTTSCWPGRARAAERSGRARAAGAADAGRPAGDGARRRTLRRSGCTCAICGRTRRTCDAFPGLRRQPAGGVRRETELFVESQLREDRSVLELLTAELHVRERAAGAVTTASRTCTAASSGA